MQGVLFIILDTPSSPDLTCSNPANRQEEGVCGHCLFKGGTTSAVGGGAQPATDRSLDYAGGHFRHGGGFLGHL